MNETTLGQKLNTWLSVVVVATIITITAGCGTSGDSSTTAGVGSGGTGTVTGKVADGYLVNASVFLDKNGNYQLDPGEPLATTDVHGAYRLDMATADVGRYPIVALVTKAVTIDRDSNLPADNSYVLSMPKEGVSTVADTNFISPVTSQVRELLETGLYASMPQAMDALRAKMGLAIGTDMTSDYIAANNTTMHTGAQNIATLMGNQMGQVFITSGSSTFLDVNRYRVMMGMIFANMPTVMGAITPADMSNLTTIMTTTLSGMPSMGLR
jgi:hypothetical protein